MKQLLIAAALSGVAGAAGAQVGLSDSSITLRYWDYEDDGASGSVTNFGARLNADLGAGFGIGLSFESYDQQVEGNDFGSYREIGVHPYYQFGAIRVGAYVQKIDVDFLTDPLQAYGLEAQWDNGAGLKVEGYAGAVDNEIGFEDWTAAGVGARYNLNSSFGLYAAYETDQWTSGGVDNGFSGARAGVAYLTPRLGGALPLTIQAEVASYEFDGGFGVTQYGIGVSIPIGQQPTEPEPEIFAESRTLFVRYGF